MTRFSPTVFGNNGKTFILFRICLPIRACPGRISSMDMTIITSGRFYYKFRTGKERHYHGPEYHHVSAA